ncbi:PorV/PorQ family protein [Pararhodonellum marinum]|uniref:hypothetical protein n=1 Tax=Pararhodonellum marinum TaxID=2755358 RepID=UPI001E612CBB|nr:hypothetical protein [Pararhodonellum marinum]
MNRLLLFCWLGMMTQGPLAWAQNGTETLPQGARSLGMANAHVTIADAWSIFNNIGALGRVTTSEVFFGYDHRLDLQELTTLAAGGTWVQEFGVLGLSLSHFGGEHFNQQNLGLGFSNTLGIVSFGVKVNYFQTNIEGFGRHAAPLFEFGGVAELSPQFFFGAHVYNFTRAKMGRISEAYLPTVVKAGISYRHEEKLMLNVEAEKDVILDPRLKVGLEYNLLDRFWGRTGIQSNPNNVFFGIGFRPGKFHLDYALSQNYQLGFTHHFSFNYLLTQP